MSFEDWRAMERAALLVEARRRGRHEQADAVEVDHFLLVAQKLPRRLLVAVRDALDEMIEDES